MRWFKRSSGKGWHIDKHDWFIFITLTFLFAFTVFWHCWLGAGKSIRPIKLIDEVLMWLSVWSMVQIVCIWSSWCHCHPQNPHHLLPHLNPHWFLPFCYWITQVVLEKRPLNGCSSSSTFTFLANADDVCWRYLTFLLVLVHSNNCSWNLTRSGCASCTPQITCSASQNHRLTCRGLAQQKGNHITVMSNAPLSCVGWPWNWNVCILPLISTKFPD